MQGNTGGRLESEFLHEEVHVLIHLEPMEIVGVALEPHQQPPVADVGAEPPLGPALVALYPVDLAVHHVLEAVRPAGPGVQGGPVALVSVAVLPEAGGQHQPELVTKVHRVNPAVDVEDEVHFK